MTPSDHLRQSIKNIVGPALLSHCYRSGTNRLSLELGDLRVIVRFSGNRGNRGTRSMFTSSWWLSSRRFRDWQQETGVGSKASGILFARNDWLLPGWPIDSLGFYVTAEAEYDRPNIHNFVTAATSVAVPLFASFKSAEGAAEWALRNLSFVAPPADLAEFIAVSERALEHATETAA